MIDGLCATTGEEMKIVKPKENTAAIERLYRAVGNYVKSAGGVVIVAGGIQIVQYPGEGTMRFSVAVKCTGRLPKFADPETGRMAAIGGQK